jgi:hypothetical protein
MRSPLLLPPIGGIVQRMQGHLDALAEPPAERQREYAD